LARKKKAKHADQWGGERMVSDFYKIHHTTM